MVETTARDPLALGKVAVAWTWIWIACDLLYAALCAYENVSIAGVDRMMFEEDLLANPAYQRLDTMIIAGIAILLVPMVAAGVVALKWVYRVNRNAHLLNDGWVRMSPGWNVAFFLIPIACLLLPFRGLRQSWQASRDPDDPGAAPVPPLMRWWWALWLASSVVGAVSFRLSMRGETVGDLVRANWVDIATTAVDVPLGLLFIALVRRFSAMQAETLRARGLTIC